MGNFAIVRSWPGETVACLATGPSLTIADVERLRGRVRVIAINDAHRLAPWADVLYSSDRYWWNHYQGVPTFTGLKIGIGSGRDKRNHFAHYPEIRVLKNTGDLGLERDPGGLRTGGNSGYAAINLAVHFGVSRILLLGYNLGYRGGRAHFFGDHPAPLQQSEARFPTWRRGFAQLVEPLTAIGVEVLNCTPDSALTTFPRTTLQAVLPTRVEMPA